MRVLLCIDDDPVLDAVLHAFDWSIASDETHRVLVLHVLRQTPLTLAVGSGGPAPGAPEALLARVTKRLDHLSATVESLTTRGDPAQAIVRVAEEAEVDLIVMGARGDDRDFFMGSVSEKVVALADTDVLVIRRCERKPEDLGRCFEALVAVDGSQGSDAGLDAFVDKLRAESAAIRLIHVVDSLPPLLEVGSPEGFFSAPRERHARLVLDKALERLRRRGLQAECDWRLGSPASQILDFAREASSDLIVVGSHGQSRLRGWILGSITQRILRHAPCSVLCARGLAPDTEMLSAGWFSDRWEPEAGTA